MYRFKCVCKRAHISRRFVDGEGYMAAVADALMAARDEIFITDWM